MEGALLAPTTDAIAIIDFGSQYAHLIANRVRRLGVYCELLLPKTPIEKLREFKGIILSGGPQSVYTSGSPTIDSRIFSLNVPILGICYGHQLIAHLLGGEVTPGKTKEYGLSQLRLLRQADLFKKISQKTQVWMSHGDTVTKMPPGFLRYGFTEDCGIAAMGSPARNVYSVQFHVEVKHTPEGMKLLREFIGLCGVGKTWTVARFLRDEVAHIKMTVGNRNVFLLVSGGVDSTVAYALLSRALGTERVYGLFVDTGLLRKDEAFETKRLLQKVGVKNFHVFSAAPVFLTALKGLTDPEKKRRIIGDLFLDIQARATQKLKLDPAHWVLGQGTIYPDTIESAGTRHSDRIKTHHNRVPAIMELIEKKQIIEPLAQLYKDEVRQLGGRLGLSKDIVWKHPFPGPGLAVRILCALTRSLPPQSRSLEKSIAAFLNPFGLCSVVAPIRSVGVGGDERSYKHPLVVWGRKNSFAALEKISTSLTNHFFAINRVCFLAFPEEIISIKLIPATLTKRRVVLLQKLDAIVMNFVKKNGMYGKVWQFPTVLVPLAVNGVKKEAVVLRPVCSDEAMTAHFYKMPIPLLKKLSRLLSPHVSAVLYDVTNKPPGTIEWE